ncbi:MAG: hypothetical protein WBZ37_06545 [Mycobacterium sp.]
MGENVPESREGVPQSQGWGERVGSVSVDWWATAVAGVIVALAVANVLPKIPW